ncbi:hypothetical protein KC319_g36 [Hortaea werneckii]|nr:hypothetical protein KC319_g36 [Hortaea werneckii]
MIDNVIQITSQGRTIYPVVLSVHRSSRSASNGMDKAGSMNLTRPLIAHTIENIAFSILLHISSPALRRSKDRSLQRLRGYILHVVRLRVRVFATIAYVAVVHAPGVSRPLVLSRQVLMRSPAGLAPEASSPLSPSASSPGSSSSRIAGPKTTTKGSTGLLLRKSAAAVSSEPTPCQVARKSLRLVIKKLQARRQSLRWFSHHHEASRPIGPLDALPTLAPLDAALLRQTSTFHPSNKARIATLVPAFSPRAIILRISGG